MNRTLVKVLDHSSDIYIVILKVLQSNLVFKEWSVGYNSKNHFFNTTNLRWLKKVEKLFHQVQVFLYQIQWLLPIDWCQQQNLKVRSCNITDWDILDMSGKDNCSPWVRIFKTGHRRLKKYNFCFNLHKMITLIVTI